MLDISFRTVRLNALDSEAPTTKTDWLWHGYLARGSLTLLTSPWKVGKTTLLTGLLRACQAGGTFLDLPCKPAKALVVSEESETLWAGRLKSIPVGPHAELLARPFRGRPTAAEWVALLDHAAARATAGELDLFVVDPLASFFPGRGENDAGSVLEMLHPLHPVAAAGAAVLLLHHPRKKASDEGNSARGSGALLGFADIVLELTRYGRVTADGRHRKLVGLSRFPETPRHLAFEWDPTSGAFGRVTDFVSAQFQDHWEQVKALLAARPAAATHKDLLMDWPDELNQPSAPTLYRWLTQATQDKLVRREGAGTKADPFRFRLPTEDDEYDDRGELPPLKPLAGYRRR